MIETTEAPPLNRADMLQHGAHAVWFERHYNPAPLFPDVAIATTQPVPAHLFTTNLPAALAAARWQSRPGEHFVNFRDRINNELRAAGIFGVCISIYERGGHFERNATGATLTEKEIA
ncbi:hypothetical protein FE249_15930 [Acidiphilium multivorum]|uniref:hypothetical protein n=1 Tax=Acidiphilium multivorum TaxID=62140 RepID=UPI001F4BF27B|nr:hypothetical protein [Acidiphilium multivorum]UNC15601.1 hypothetical protein FE249_15930 [Acidiphilium multivorum]